MKKLSEVMSALKKLGSAQTRKIYARHGAPEEQFGVKVGDLKKIAKQIKGDQELAYELFDTGNSDAMYLACLVADGSQMTKGRLQDWAKAATWYMLSECAVPSVAVESPHGRDLAMQWIGSKQERIAACGWSTYAGIVAITPDEDLFLAEVRELVDRVVKEIDEAPNRVRYAMNGFVIAVGGYVKPLLNHAKKAAAQVGIVSVDMGETECKTPLASAYIQKIESTGRIGKKRKTMKC